MYRAADIVIVSHNTIVREGLRRIVEERDFTVSQSVDAISKIQHEIPQKDGVVILLVDSNDPNFQVEDVQTIKRQHQDMRVVLLSDAFEFDTMVKAFEIAGLSKETVEERFGGLYRAFQYGAPPHGGMAAGVDRIVMLLCGAKNLREITMFPMNQQAVDLLMGAPGDVDATQLTDLGLRLMPKRED